MTYEHRVDTAMVTGSRWWGDAEIIKEALQEFRPRLVLVGDAPGADTICAALCRQMTISYKVFPAEWNRYNKAAGPIRNQDMIDHEPDVVLAFMHPESKGTRDAVRRATARGIPVITYYWD